MDEAEKNEQTPNPPAPAPAGSVGPMGAMGEFSDSGATPVARTEPVEPIGPMGAMRMDESESETATPPPIQPEPEPGPSPFVEPAPAEHLPPAYEEIPIAPAVADIPYSSASGLPLDYRSLAPPAVRAPRRAAPVGWIQWPVIAAAIAFAFVAVKYQGWELRKTAYMWGDGMHWGDAANAYTLYGRVPQTTGLFDAYEKIKTGQVAGDQVKLDYPPLRLAIINRWVQWGTEHKVEWITTPFQHLYESRFPAMEPMLRLNMACEGISAILIFTIIWIWTRRMRNPDEPNAGWIWPIAGFVVVEGIAAWLFFKNGKVADATTLIFFYFGAVLLARIVPGLAPALAGALLFWFNPAVIWNAYVWPQWDVWVFPFALGAILLASTESWFGAGVLIAIGTLLKGQMLMFAPIFLLWPFFRLQWKQMLRFVGGFALTFAVIIFPWMLPDTSAKVWIALVAVAMGLLVPVALGVRMSKPVTIGFCAAALLLAWPWTSSAAWTLRLCAISVVALAALGRLAPRAMVPSIYAIALAGAIFLMIPLHNASNAWYTQGYKYGTEKFMEIGTTVSGAGGTSYTNNLPVLFQRVFNWRPDHAIELKIDVTWLKWIGLGWVGPMVSLRSFMFSIYGICLVLCSIGAAVHSRRNDTRLLACLIAPWFCSFILLTQLNNRYLVWAAGMSALLPAVGVGMTLLGIIVSVACWIGMAQLQYTKFPVDPGMAQLINPLSPHIGWLLALAAAVYLYVSVMPRPRDTYEPLPLAPAEAAA